MNMKMLVLPFILIFLLGGCNMKNSKPGDGRHWMEISCSGFADWTECYEEARRLCPSGYDVANPEESLIAQKRVMQIACQKSIDTKSRVLPE